MSTPRTIRLVCLTQGGMGDNLYYLNGKELGKQALERSLSFRNHSPTGFNHGYSGSGPAQLALAICLEVYGLPGRLIYQDFKQAHIATLPNQQEGFDVKIDLTPWDQKLLGNYRLLEFGPGMSWQEKRTNIEAALDALYADNGESYYGEAYLWLSEDNPEVPYRYLPSEEEIASEYDDQEAAQAQFGKDRTNLQQAQKVYILSYV